MAVKTLSYFLDRLKVGLRDDTCVLCHGSFVPPRSQMLCAPCERRILLRQPLPLLSLAAGPMYAACEFPYRMKRMLYDLKFHEKAHHGLLLAEILIHYWQHLPVSKGKRWVVVPIPPHQDRERAHLTEIGRPFASHFGYDFMADGLLWTRQTQTQHTLLNKRKRRENVLGSFEVNPALIKRLQPDSKILILDDIITTGATLVEGLQTCHQVHPNNPVVALAVSHVPLAVNRA